MAKNWRPLFDRFASELRIASKETSDIDPRGSKWDLWTSQQRFLDMVLDGLDEDIHDFTCLKSRQLGITTVSLAIDLFWLAIHPGMLGALVVDSEGNRDIFRDVLRRYIQSFPKGFLGKSFVIVKGGDNRNYMKFSNNSRLDFLVAGTTNKTTWGESRGYALAHCTEVAKYGSGDGLSSFREGLAETNPERLFMYESTAKGMNHWRDQWTEYGRDEYTKRRLFVGWWAKSINSIARNDRRFPLYGLQEPNEVERELIERVRDEYDWNVTDEQLAWYRWRESSQATSSQSLEQNQPWHAEQAFVLSGYSFFQVRKIQDQYDQIINADPPVVFEGFRFWLGNDFFASHMEKIWDGSRLHEVELRVWDQPISDAQYVIGCDPAMGRNDNKDRHCHGSDTEILTRQGWKQYTDIALGDEAVCFDLDTGQYTYGPILDKIVKDHDGPMVRFTSKGLDCHVTPEHRCISRAYQRLRDGRKMDWRVYTAQDLVTRGRTVMEMPIGGSPCGAGIADLSLDMCRALGWMLTDGYIGRPEYHGNGSREGNRPIRAHIIIAQGSHTERAGINVSKAMRTVLTRLFPSVTVTDLPSTDDRASHTLFRIGAKIAAPILAWLDEDDNRIPRRILTEGSREQLEALFQGIAEGDGSWDGRWGWIKISPGLHEGFADDIQELAAKLGYSVSKTLQPAAKRGKHDQYIIRLSRRVSHTFEAGNAKHEHYTGKVWCVTVPTGAFVARRNGKMFVTGNCVSVWRCYADRLVQVAEYADNHYETRQAAWVLAYLAGAYRNCMINLEITGGYGQTVMTELDNVRNQLRAEVYNEKVQARGWGDFLSTARWYLYHKPDSPGAGYVYNWNSTFDAKNRMLSGFRDAHVTDILAIRSINLLDEMSIVVQDGSEIGAPNKSKDDRVFAAALACEAWNRWFRPAMLAEGYIFDVVQARELGQQTIAGSMVARLVQNTLKLMNDDDEEANVDPERKFLEEKGLA